MSDTTLAETPTAPSTESSPAKAKPASPFTNRNFRLLIGGESVSLFGDQFYMVALPWLVLQMQGGTEAVLGLIIMLGGIPRAIFMLLGGVLTDRFAPRTLMIVSNLARFIIALILVFLVVTNTTQLWMLFVISVAFGITDAFFYPANMAITPMIVEEDQLEATNAIVMGTGITIGAVGPGIAGILVSKLSLGLSFLLDAVTFLIAAGTEVMMRTPKAPKPAEEHGSIVGEIGSMLRYVASDTLLRDIILISTVLNFFFNGALLVGPAALAKNRYPEGAVALGILLSAFSVGALLGMGAGGVWKPKRFGSIALVFIGLGGVSLGFMGVAPTLVTGTIAALITGAGTGFANIVIITWMQRRIAKEMMGRVMSLIGLAAFGTTPIAAAFSGFVASVDITLLFVICGAGLVLSCILGMFSDIRKIRAEVESQ
jgi:MFS family permease